MKRFQQFQSQNINYDDLSIEEGFKDEVVGFGRFLKGIVTGKKDGIGFRDIPVTPPPAPSPAAAPAPAPAPVAKKTEPRKLGKPTVYGSKIHSPFHGSEYMFGEKGGAPVAAKLLKIDDPGSKGSRIRRPEGKPAAETPKLKGTGKPVARFGEWSQKVVAPSKGSPFEFAGPKTSTWGQVTVPLSSRGGFELNIPKPPKPREARRIPQTELLGPETPVEPKPAEKATAPKAKPAAKPAAKPEQPTLFTAPPTTETPRKAVKKQLGIAVVPAAPVAPVGSAVSSAAKPAEPPRAKAKAKPKNEDVDYSYLDNALNEGMGDWIDKVQDYADWGAAALSFIPGGNLIGTGIMTASAVTDALQGQKTSAAVRGGLAALGLIPGLGGVGGLAIKGGRAAARSAYKTAAPGIIKTAAGTTAKYLGKYARVMRTPSGSRLVSGIGRTVGGLARAGAMGLAAGMMGQGGGQGEEESIAGGASQSRQAGSELYRPERQEMRRQAFVQPQLAY
jgi:hypothetical protein